MKNIQNLISEAEKACENIFEQVEDNVLFNQRKVLAAFQENRVALSHFAPSSGYGYEDLGKHKLGDVFATALCCESAIVSPLIVSGTHALTIGLFGLLRPGDLVLSITGEPYESLKKAIWGKGTGSLTEFGVRFECIDDLSNRELILSTIKDKKPKMVYLQRSCGYSMREGITIAQMENIFGEIKKLDPSIIIFVDNCYGTFLERREPSEVGADIIVDSLIKNPGGGIAPTGAYIAGRVGLINLISSRLTAPGLRQEVGSYAGSYTPFFQGFFLAPRVVGNAVKGSALIGKICETIGMQTTPNPANYPNDMVRKIIFNDREKMVSFVQSIQACSAVDSYLTPIPDAMPGYSSEVIMASGSFNQGSSIELSCDGPVRPPYVAYIQGGLTYEHIRIAIEEAFSKII